MGSIREYSRPKDVRYYHPRFESVIVWVRYLALDDEERRMDMKPPDEIWTMRMDKSALKHAVEELNEQMGFVPVPGMAAELSQKVFLEARVISEDNTASFEIKRMRVEHGGT